MCCITDIPAAGPQRQSLRPAHRKSASMDSFFITSMLSNNKKVHVLDCGQSRRPAAKSFASDDDERSPAPQRARARTEDLRDCAPPAAAANTKKAETMTKEKKRLAVRFSRVNVREYIVIVGDSPSCNTGIPISLGWESVDSLTASVDTYERIRAPARRTCSGHEAAKVLSLGRKQRFALLVDVGGYSHRDLVRAERKIRMRERAEFFGLPAEGQVGA